MEIILLGVVISFNILIIKWKLNNNHKEDAFFDVTLNIIITILFHGTIEGMAAGMVASFIISIYFLISPPEFIKSFKNFTSRISSNSNSLNNFAFNDSSFKSHESISVYDSNGNLDYEATVNAFKSKYQRPSK